MALKETNIQRTKRLAFEKNNPIKTTQLKSISDDLVLMMWAGFIGFAILFLML